jgi:hypothetical protein
MMVLYEWRITRPLLIVTSIHSVKQFAYFLNIIINVRWFKSYLSEPFPQLIMTEVEQRAYAISLFYVASRSTLLRVVKLLIRSDYNIPAIHIDNTRIMRVL